MQHTQLHNPMLFVGLEKKSKFKYMEFVHGKNYSLDEIMQAIAKCYGISKSELFNSSRKRELVNLRFIFVHNAVYKTTNTLAKIGEFMQDREHWMIIYYRDQYEKLYGTNKPFTELANKFKL